MPEVAVEVESEYDEAGMEALRSDMDRTASAVESSGERMENTFDKVGSASEASRERVKKANEDISKSSEETARRTRTSSKDMVKSYIDIAGKVATLTTAGMSLADTWVRVSKGEMGTTEAVVRALPAMVSMAAAIWSIVAAETARAGASAAANVASAGWFSPAMALLIGGAIGAVVGTVITSLATLPSREIGGFIPATGPYLLHAGERVLPRGIGPITVIINEAATPKETANEVINRLRRKGVV